MKLVTATPNATYCDTDEVLTAAGCALLRANGIRGVFRYLSGLFQPERDVILASGLELYFVNYAHDAGWLPSAAGGKADAQRDLAALARLAIPIGVHVAFDLKGPGDTAPDVIAHVTEHATMIDAARYLPSLYVGEGSLLTSVQLYNLPSVLYWHSCSQLRDGNSGLEPMCGYSISQGRPFEVKLTDAERSTSMFGTAAITTVTIDYDNVVEDFNGRLPIGIAA